VRHYFQRRLLLIHVIGLALIASCLLLSHWQWNRAHYARQAVPVSKPVAFEKLSSPRDFLPPSSVGQLTQVSGTWQTGSQVLLPSRPIDGRKLLQGSQPALQTDLGNWVLELLRLKDGTSVGVIRGWHSATDRFPSASGSASLRGVVQPAEDAPNSAAVIASPLITTKFLLSHANTDIRDGFIVETSIQNGLTQVIPSRAAFTETGLRTLNVFYTFNWIFFALLILLIWIRIVRDEVSSAT